MDQVSTLDDMKPTVEPGPHAGLGFREFVALLAAMMAMMGLGIDTMLPALPQIGRSLGIMDENARQWIINAYVMGFGAATIFYGPISDRFGRKTLIVGGMAGYAVCSAGVALAPSFATVLALRVLQGASVAATRVVATSMVRDCYSGRQMARVMSLAMMIFMAVPVLAPSIGQIIMLVFPWRGLFLVLAGYGVLVFLWASARLPETLHPRYRRPIKLGAVLSGLRIALTTRQAAGYMVVQALLQGALLGMINSVEQIFADSFHAPRMMPAVFAGIAGTMAVAALVNSRIVERFGTRRVGHSAVIGCAAIQIVHLLVALSGHETIASYALLQALAMGCFGLCTGNFGAIALEPLAALAGTAASVQSFVMMVGGTILGAVIGQSFDGTPVPMIAGFAGMAALSILVILWTEKGRLFHPQMGA